MGKWKEYFDKIKIKKEEVKPIMIDNIDEIKAQFKEVIRYSQGIENPYIPDSVFDTWYKNKKDFITAFDNQLIYEFPNKISFPMSFEERDRRIEDFCVWLDEEYEYHDLAAFVDINRKDFFDNILSKDYTMEDGKKIKAGTKIIKSFKYFDINPALLEDIQNEASRIIQEDCIEGYLCFSVHPLDFLSVSETTHKWRSCHALDGEHRSGNVSYMMDKCTFIAYLRSENTSMKLPNFPDSVPWNSKKWRTLMYISDDRSMLMVGKQYPFSSDVGIKEVATKYLPIALGDNRNFQNTFMGLNNQVGTEKISELFNKYITKFTFDESTFEEVYFEEGSKLVPVGNTLKQLYELIHEEEEPLEYNDLLYSSTYTLPYYAYFRNKSFWSRHSIGTGLTTDKTRFTIGARVPCFCCGGDRILNGGTFKCYDCVEEEGD